MSLLDQRRKIEKQAAEEVARRAEAERIRLESLHPVIKAGCKRNVRDAYFAGLVFAALVGDEKVDASERALLGKIGASMELPESEIDGVIARVQALEVPQKFELRDETAACIKGNTPLVRLFASEFICVWSASEHVAQEEDLSILLRELAERTGTAISETSWRRVLKLFSAGKPDDSELFALAGSWLDEDVLAYLLRDLCGDVKERIARVRETERQQVVLREMAAVEERNIQEARRQALPKTDAFANANMYQCAVAADQLQEFRDALGQLVPYAGHLEWASILLNSISRDLKEFVLRGVSGYAAVTMEVRSRRQRIVWKLAAMLYVFRGTLTNDDRNSLNGLLRAARQSATDYFDEQVVTFIREKFNVTFMVTALSQIAKDFVQRGCLAIACLSCPERGARVDTNQLEKDAKAVPKGVPASSSFCRNFPQ